MTHEQKLKAVTDKICELLKGTELDPMALKPGCMIKDDLCEDALFVAYYDGRFVYSSNKDTNVRYHKYNSFKIIGSPICEAEALAALYKAGVTEVIMQTNGGLIDMSRVLAPFTQWELGKPLSLQSPETIDFLFNVLNCE